MCLRNTMEQVAKPFVPDAQSVSCTTPVSHELKGNPVKLPHDPKRQHPAIRGCIQYDLSRRLADRQLVKTCNVHLAELRSKRYHNCDGHTLAHRNQERKQEQICIVALQLIAPAAKNKCTPADWAPSWGRLDSMPCCLLANDLHLKEQE